MVEMTWSATPGGISISVSIGSSQSEKAIFWNYYDMPQVSLMPCGIQVCQPVVAV